MTATQFQAALKHLISMSLFSFQDIFWEDADYLWKLYIENCNKDVGLFVARLDEVNLQKLFTHFKVYFEKYGVN